MPETRGFVRLRVIAVVYVILFAFVLIVAAALLVFGTSIYRFLLERSSAFLAPILMKFKSLAGFVVLFGFFTLLYTGVPRRRVKLSHNLAGAAFSAAGWVLFSFFFSIFVERFSDFSIYGSLATFGDFDVLAVLLHVHQCFGGRGEHVLETSSIGMDVKNLRKKRKKRRARNRRQRSAKTDTTHTKE